MLPTTAVSDIAAFAGRADLSFQVFARLCADGRTRAAFGRWPVAILEARIMSTFSLPTQADLDRLAELWTPEDARTWLRRD